MTKDELHRHVAEASGAFEVYAIESFRLTRSSPRTGGERFLLLTVMDAGVDAGHRRYMVEVCERDGDVNSPYSLSNPDATIEDALGGVHWNDFD